MLCPTYLDLMLFQERIDTLFLSKIPTKKSLGDKSDEFGGHLIEPRVKIKWFINVASRNYVIFREL